MTSETVAERVEPLERKRAPDRPATTGAGDPRTESTRPPTTRGAK